MYRVCDYNHYIKAKILDLIPLLKSCYYLYECVYLELHTEIIHAFSMKSPNLPGKN
jgi:hypothetical protein